MIDFEKYNSKFLIYLLITFFSAYYLFPLLISGFIGDDLYNSQIRGRLFYEDINILEFYYRETISCIGIMEDYFNFYVCILYIFFLKSALAIKIYVVSLILLNLIIFSKIIYYLIIQKITLYFIY